MGHFIITVAVVAAVFSVASAVPQYRRVEAHYGGDVTAYQDIMLDEDEQYVVVTVSKLTSKKVSPSINLHDFAAGFSAIKNVEEGTCYIDRTRHTLNQMKTELQRAERDKGYYDVKQWFTCTSKKLVEKSEMSQYGERLAAFCEDYESIYTERTYTKRSRRSLRMVDETALGCFICSGYCWRN